MGYPPVRAPCVICQKLTACTNLEGSHACLTHGGIVPNTIKREQRFLTGDPCVTIIMPGKDGYLLGIAAEGDTAPADNGGWFAVWMRKLLVDPIQYPARKSSGKRD